MKGHVMAAKVDRKKNPLKLSGSFNAEKVEVQ